MNRKGLKHKLATTLIASSIALSACGTSNTISEGSNPVDSQTSSNETASEEEPTEEEAIPDDLATLSDDFDDASTLSNWPDLSAVEGNQNWIEKLDINETHPGEMYLVPYASGWFEDWRGVLLHKEVTGDFDVTTRIQVKGKATDVPEKIYSLAGLMARAPREGGMEAWEAKKEDWVFITTGYGDPSKGEGKPQLETKTTDDSRSDLRLIASRTDWLNLRMIKLASTFYMFYQFEGEEWKLSRVFTREDMPETLQVGLLAYTDWDQVIRDPQTFNNDPSKLPGDLIVRSDYIHFKRPQLSQDLKAKLKDGTLMGKDLIEYMNKNSQ